MRCGDWKLDTTDADEQTLTITQIINHPNVTRKSNIINNDIALLKVSGSLTCTPGKIMPACLPNTNVSETSNIDVNFL